MVSLQEGLLWELRAIFPLFLNFILVGFDQGFSAVAIPGIKMELELRGNTSSVIGPGIEASNEELSWFASCGGIADMIVGFVAGYCGGRFGLKKTILISCVPAILGWISIAFSPSIGILIASKAFCGFCICMCTANGLLLVAEYSSNTWRGTFLASPVLLVGIGTLTSYSLGAGLHWRYDACFPALGYGVMSLALYSVPESPIWILSHKGKNAAGEALAWLRASNEVTKEVEELETIREKKSNGLTMVQALYNLSRYDIRMPFLLILANFYLTMFSGPLAMITYSVQILQESFETSTAYLTSIMVAIVRIVGGILAIFLIQKITQRSHIMMSMTIMSLSMILLGSVMYFKQQGFDTTMLRVLPILSITLYMFSFGAGAGPLQSVFVGELLPVEYKVLSGILHSLHGVAGVIVIKIFPNMIEMLKPYGTYWMFAGFACMSNISARNKWEDLARNQEHIQIKQRPGTGVWDIQ